jgi:hypothetical protein
MNAFLIENENQILQINLDIKDTVLCHNISTYYKIDYKKKKYFFKNKKPSDKKFIDDLLNNWFKSAKGESAYNYNGYSLALILNRGCFFSTLNDFKNYFALKLWSIKFNKIYLSRYSCPSILRVKKFFNNVYFLPFDRDKFIKSEVIPSTPDRTHYFHQKNNFIKKIFFYLDKFFFIRWKKNKIFALKDTKHNDAFNKINNILTLSNKNFFKGIYLCKEDNRNFFPKKISLLKHVLIHSIIRKKFPKDQKNLKSIFIKNINTQLNDNFENINATVASLEKSFKIYKPKSIILNSSVDWFSVILIYLSKKFNTTSYYLLEGYMLFKDIKNIPENDSQISLIDNFFSYGKSFKKILHLHKIKNNNIYNIETIFLKNSKNNFKKSYDACLLSYSPNPFSLDVTWDKQIITELQVLKVFDDLGFKNILIKLKNSAPSKKKTEIKEINIYREIYEKIYKKKLKLDITISDKNFNDILSTSKLIVGGLSTAIVEANKITDYYLYEPAINAYCEYEFNSINAFNKKYINTNSKSLFKSIKQKKVLKLKKDAFNKDISFSGAMDLINAK